MQTFLPYADFVNSARVLDYRRLGKQRVEAYQIMRALLGESRGWVNHPATKLWEGHEHALATYGSIVCFEWRSRGYKDTLLEKFQEYSRVTRNQGSGLPELIGDLEFHKSHQSNLIRKDPEFYRPIFGYLIPDDLPYIWE